MGQAVSSAAHAAKAAAKQNNEKVGPAVSAAVHQAQRSFRDREAGDEDREVGSTSGRATTSGGVTAGSGSRATTTTRP